MNKEKITEKILSGEAITEEEFNLVKDEWIGIPILVKRRNGGGNI